MLKKQMIMDKALELFAQQGFNATSVQQITDHCGISKGAFYLSFKSKDELIFSIIDHFMLQHTVKLDCLVKSGKTNDLLFDFYYTSYEFVMKHANFAKFFIQEIQTFNEELIGKLSYYDTIHEKIIINLIERVYGENSDVLKYDLLYCIKSFIGMYVELILFKNMKLDIYSLAKSLVEKTNILANNMKLPLITSNHLQHLNIENNDTLTKESISQLLEQKIKEVENSLVKDSLILIRRNLDEENLPSAVVKGLIENIRNDKSCEWVAYILLQYYQF